jgi:hypothetical protein
MIRHRWEAVVAGTGELVSAPYYVAAAAKRVAERVARERGVAVEVQRDGRVWETIEPGSTS